MKKIKKIIKKIISEFYKIKISNINACAENDSIIIAFSSKNKINGHLTIGREEFEISNNEANLPLTKYKINRVRTGNFELKKIFLNKTIPINLEKQKLNFTGLYKVIDEKKYRHAEDKFIEVLNIDYSDNRLIFEVNTFDFYGEDDYQILVTDSSYNLLDSIRIENKSFLVNNLQDLVNKESIFIFGARGDEWVDIVYGKTCSMIEPYIVQCEDSQIVVKNTMYERYFFSTNNSLNKLLTFDKNNIIKKIKFDKNQKAFFLYEKDQCDDYSKIRVFIVSGSRNEGVPIYESHRKELYKVPIADNLLEATMNEIERLFFFFEIRSNSGDVMEEGFITIPDEKKRDIEHHVLLENTNNRLIILNNKIVALENKNNYLSYPEKYKYDFKRNTFLTDFEIVSYENSILEISFKIKSILSKISHIVIFLNDTYASNSFKVYSKKMDFPQMIFKDNICIDLSEANKIHYYNSRMNFKVGVVYVDGYREEGFLNKEYRNLSANDRYLLVSENTKDKDMVEAFYLGENLHNLNVWYTSREELERGMSFQNAKEKYYETINNDEMDSQLVFFEANLGKQYTGNPKYIYEYMQKDEQFVDFSYVWAYPDSNSNNFYPNTIVVKRGSEEYFYYLAKAKYLVNNIRFPIHNKRPGARYLNTWHGTPLKKLGFDIEVDGPERQAFGDMYAESLNWDYLLADNDYCEEKLKGAFDFKKTILKKGYPINDIYFDEEKKQLIKEKIETEYPAIKGKKIILYAPTWRDLQGDYIRGYNFDLPFSIQDFYDELKDEYVLVIKLHHLIADNIHIEEQYNNFVINASSVEDIMEIMILTDILITDYSSVFFDFSCARKPILFYMYDLDEYAEKTRGLYMSTRELPGPIIKDSNNLLKYILNIRDDKFEYQKDLDNFCDQFSKYCHGNSSQQVVEAFFKEASE